MRASTPMARREYSNFCCAARGDAQPMRHTTKQARAAILLAILAALAACETPRPAKRADSRPVEAPAVRSEPARAVEAPAIGAEKSSVAQPTLETGRPTRSEAQIPSRSASVTFPPNDGTGTGMPTSTPRLERFDLLVPGTTSKLVLVPIPAPAETRLGETSMPPRAFLASTTEITWDMYDAFVFAMDRGETEKDPPDAFARPSKPYITMDRGFGHAGYPVISVSFRGASEFCRWLSARTGRRFRLPTEGEWLHAARGGSEDLAAVSSPEALEARAWYQANSKVRGRASTRPVGRKTPNDYGLHDVLGNAAEWTVGPDGKGVLRGGSFKEPASSVALEARVPDDPAFNATDPQIPKSVWWLADGPFAGFRVVCDP